MSRHVRGADTVNDATSLPHAGTFGGENGALAAICAEEGGAGRRSLPAAPRPTSEKARRRPDRAPLASVPPYPLPSRKALRVAKFQTMTAAVATILTRR